MGRGCSISGGSFTSTRSPASICAEPARRPVRAPAVGLHAARVRGRSGPRYASGIRDPGPDRPARHVAQPQRLQEELPELADELFASGSRSLCVEP